MSAYNSLRKYCSMLMTPLCAYDANDNQLVMRSCQERMLSAICRWKYTVVSTPRQIGGTTAIAAWCLWSADELGQRVIYVSNNSRAAIYACEKATSMIRNRPDVACDKMHIRFNSGGGVTFGSINSIADERYCDGYDHVAIDNAAFSMRLENVLKTVDEAISGRLVLLSAQADVDGDDYFGQLCVAADTGESKFRHLRITLRDSWSGDEKGLQDFTKSTIKSIGREKFLREFGNYPDINYKHHE